MKKHTNNIKTWDLDFAKTFFNNNKNYIEDMSLGLYFDNNVIPLDIIKRGLMNCSLDSLTFPITIDGVKYTAIDTPCLIVKYKGGKEEIFECYLDGYKEKEKLIFFGISALNPVYIGRHHKLIEIK